MSIPGHRSSCPCEDCCAETELPLGPSEVEKVERFKLDRLLLAGYPLAEATQIAHSPADWHRAEDLLFQGCPASTAVLILL